MSTREVSDVSLERQVADLEAITTQLKLSEFDLWCFGDASATGWPPKGQVGAAIGGSGGAVNSGGPGAHGHFTVDGLAPGASFCNPQAHPNGFNTPGHFAP